jgi:hypothetical protein
MMGLEPLRVLEVEWKLTVFIGAAGIKQPNLLPMEIIAFGN